ncbi:MAG: hypothetical protein L6Q54_14900 [Leptospiraceae bacterium]|nr:hypothetical protein [Leptospiraceae bacterium]MCK6382522.1 hypothetical protein [Leptospiraceae bacterium]NUM41895.1 hypothetical protein [Leptospiraceae bacterium]
MASLTIEETRKKVHVIVSQLQKGSFDEAEENLSDVLVTIQKDYLSLESNVPRNHDIALLIQEMRNGFSTMNKRFEQMDKRFDDLIHQMDKRFEQVDKRFEQVDKRFDDLIHQMDKRFSFMQWTFGIFLSLVGIMQALLLGILSAKVF